MSGTSSAKDSRKPYQRLQEQYPQLQSPRPGSATSSNITLPSLDPSTPGEGTPSRPAAAVEDEWRDQQQQQPGHRSRTSPVPGSESDSESDLHPGDILPLRDGYSDYRIRCLETKLLDDNLSEEQRENIRVALSMYRGAQGLPKWDGLVFIQDGMVVGGDQVDRNREYWFEVSYPRLRLQLDKESKTDYT
jgi:hypothetical protein